MSWMRGCFNILCCGLSGGCENQEDRQNPSKRTTIQMHHTHLMKRASLQRHNVVPFPHERAYALNIVQRLIRSCAEWQRISAWRWASESGSCVARRTGGRLTLPSTQESTRFTSRIWNAVHASRDCEHLLKIASSPGDYAIGDAERIVKPPVIIGQPTEPRSRLRGGYPM